MHRLIAMATLLLGLAAAPLTWASSAGDGYLNLVLAKIQQHYRYPDDFRRAGLAGKVHCSMTVARNGNVVEVKLVRSSGSAEIDSFVEGVVVD